MDREESCRVRGVHPRERNKRCRPSSPARIGGTGLESSFPPAAAVAIAMERGGSVIAFRIGSDVTFG